jgi:hypothetical protein
MKVWDGGIGVVTYGLEGTVSVQLDWTKKRSENMSSGRRNKKSKSKQCKESYSIKRRQHERAFQAHYPKAAARGGGSLLIRLSLLPVLPA